MEGGRERDRDRKRQTWKQRDRNRQTEREGRRRFLERRAMTVNTAPFLFDQ